MEFEVLLSAVMAVNVGSAPKDSLKLDVTVVDPEEAEVRKAVC